MTASDATTTQKSKAYEAEKSGKIKAELNPRVAIRDHVVMCSIFTIVFTAYMAIQNLQTSLNKEANVGLVSLIIIYSLCVFVSAISPAIVSKLGAKWSLAMGWTGHCLFTAANFYPVMWTMVPASLVLGFVAVPVWTVQGMYVTTQALKYAELTAKDTAATLAKFNGVFWTFFQSTQVTGNLVSSFILYTDNGSTVGNDTAMCGPRYCPVPDVAANHTTNITNSTSDYTDQGISLTTIYTIMGVFACLDVLGLILTILFLKPIKTTEVNIKERLKSVFKQFAKVDVLLLLPLYTLNGYEQAFIFGDFTNGTCLGGCDVGVQKPRDV